MRDMEIKVPYTTIAKREWSEVEDRWLVIQMLRLGIDREDIYEQIFNEIQYGNDPVIEMNFWLQSRSAQEIGRRCQTLLGSIVREHEAGSKKRGRTTGTGKGKSSGGARGGTKSRKKRHV